MNLIDEQQSTITKQVGELVKQIKPEPVNPFDGVMFALLQHHLHTTTLIAKLTARNMDLTYGNHQLTIGLDRLTKWLTALTFALGLFALPLAIDVVVKWFK
jgi:hypothetical protein